MANISVNALIVAGNHAALTNFISQAGPTREIACAALGVASEETSFGIEMAIKQFARSRPLCLERFASAAAGTDLEIEADFSDPPLASWRSDTGARAPAFECSTIYLFRTDGALPSVIVKAMSVAHPTLHFALRYAMPSLDSAWELHCRGGRIIRDLELDIGDVWKEIAAPIGFQQVIYLS